MASILKQSSQNKQSTWTLKTTEGLQIFNKLTVKKTSVPGIKAQKSVYKQRQTNTHLEDRTNTVETQLSNSCTEAKHMLQDTAIPFKCKGNERV